MNFNRTIIFIVICFSFESCKLTEKDAIGYYRWEKVRKTTLKINPDKTFQFERNNPNPYLHPFDHPDENYFITHGTWSLSKRKIILMSSEDSLVYPLYQIKKSEASDSTYSHFTFIDSDLDPVKILYVKLSDSSMVSALHRSMDDFKHDLRDTQEMEFHFYGYRSLNFVPDKAENADYTVTLSPEYRPSIFKETELTLGRKKLIDKKANAVFRKVE
jgi:hypothetical protein